MRLLDRYLLRELLVPLGYCLGGFLVFYVAFDLIFSLSRFMDAHLSFWDIAQYYVVTLPELLVEQVLPVSLLLALLYATTQHNRCNELTAIRAAGVSLWRLSLPYFAVAGAFGLAMFLIGELWLPSADQRAKDILQRRLADPPQSKQWTRLTFHNEATHRLWTISRFDRRTSEILHLYLTTYLPNGVVRIIEAQPARYRDGHWLLFNAATWDQAPGGAFPTLVGTNSVLSLTLPETPAWLRSEIKLALFSPSDAGKSPQLSIQEIREYLRLHPQIEAAKKAMLLTQLQEHLAAPFTCLAVVLIALPFGARAGRHNVFVGVASSIFICFGYFILQRVSSGLGVGGILPPVLAAWLPNLICVSAGLALLLRVR